MIDTVQDRSPPLLASVFTGLTPERLAGDFIRLRIVSPNHAIVVPVPKSRDSGAVEDGTPRRPRVRDLQPHARLFK